MGFDPTIAAGAVVRRGDGMEAELAIVHRPKYDDWSFPKGKLEPHEHILACAVREVVEETNLAVSLRRPLSSREYLVDDKPKVVHYWVAEVTATMPFSPNREVDRLEWVSPAQAERRLTQPRDAELVEQAMTRAPGTPFAIVRHAKARKRSAWRGPDRDRPLTPAGRSAAKALVPVLAAYGIGRLHSSPAVRCLSSLRPYAKRNGLAVLVEPTLDEESFAANPAAALERASQLVGDTSECHAGTAVCTHRPAIPALVGHLLEGSGLAGPTETFPPASLLVLHLAASGLVASEFHTVT